MSASSHDDYEYESEDEQYSDFNELCDTAVAAEIKTEGKIIFIETSTDGEIQTTASWKSSSSSNNRSRVSDGTRTSALMDAEPVRTMLGDSYVIVPVDKVEPLMAALDADTSALLDIDDDSALTLLVRFQWNKEKLIDFFYSHPDKLHDIGINLTDIIGSTNCAMDCSICFSREEDTVGLSCNHKFCSACFAEYLRVHLVDGPSCIHTHCPQHKCPRVVPQSMFARLLSPEQLKKYSFFVLRNFIDLSRGMTWCPAPGCELIAVGLSPGCRSVRCNCSHVFCFACAEEGHQPASCRQLASWSEKCANESETANWILLNTKKCPHCSSRIEKNQGCNHMNCKLCKFEFCWICLGSWADHGSSTGGYYKCNRFQSSTAEGEQQSSLAKAKQELERYLHYYQRYHGHEQAAKYARRQREQAERRMGELQAQEQSAWVDVQFLQQAVEQVVDCRRVLKYTYIFGFFLTDDDKLRNLFEHQQEMLEKNTEKLSELTETTLHIATDRTNIVNLTRVTEKFMTSLLISLVDGNILDTGEN